MPPVQCPECGRFLSNDFVQSLAVEPSACPKCETRLTPAHFPDELGQAAAPAGPSEEPAAAAELRADAAPDPLEGWDTPGAAVLDMDRYRVDAGPPPDGAIIAGAAAMGVVVGALASSRRGRGALLGGLAGAVAAGVARQVWRAPE